MKTIIIKSNNELLIEELAQTFEDKDSIQDLVDEHIRDIEIYQDEKEIIIINID